MRCFTNQKRKCVFFSSWWRISSRIRMKTSHWAKSVFFQIKCLTLWAGAQGWSRVGRWGSPRCGSSWWRGPGRRLRRHMERRVEANGWRATRLAQFSVCWLKPTSPLMGGGGGGVSNLQVTRIKHQCVQTRPEGRALLSTPKPHRVSPSAGDWGSQWSGDQIWFLCFYFYYSHLIRSFFLIFVSVFWSTDFTLLMPCPPHPSPCLCFLFLLTMNLLHSGHSDPGPPCSCCPPQPVQGACFFSGILFTENGGNT